MDHPDLFLSSAPADDCVLVASQDVRFKLASEMSGVALGCRDGLAYPHLSGGLSAAGKQLERRLRAGIAGEQTSFLMFLSGEPAFWRAVVFLASVDSVSVVGQLRIEVSDGARSESTAVRPDVHGQRRLPRPTCRASESSRSVAPGLGGTILATWRGETRPATRG